MIGTLYRLALCVVLSSVAGAASSQNEASEVTRERDGSDARDRREKCFLVPAVIDLQVMSDRHVYVGTRGGNHYVLTTPHCENLERSYVRSEVRLVNYGRRVCEHDGSYLRYHSGTRETTCAILTIDAVENRAEARSIAADDGDLVELEAIDPGDPPDPLDPSDPPDPAARRR
jgi:hypothetical protein